MYTNVLGKINTISNNVAVKGSAIVAIGSLVGSVFSYLLHFALGRMITVEEYGIFNALLSLGVLLGVITGGFAQSFVKIVAELKSFGKFDVLSALFYKVIGLTTGLSLVIFFLVFLFRHSLANYLNVDNPNVFLGFGIYLGLTMYQIIPNSFLQGLLRYKAFAFFNIVSGFFRLVFPLVFVLLGFSVGGIYLGLALGFTSMLLVSTFLLKKNLSISQGLPIRIFPQLRKVATLSVATIFFSTGITLLVNTDVVLVKHLLDPVTAGIYSSVVTVGKILLFGSSSITIVMFPQITSAYIEGSNYRSKFRDFFLVQTVVAVAGVVFFSLFAENIVGVMFGPNFLEAVPFVSKYTLFMGLYVMINFMMLFFLAINKTKIFVALLPAVVAQYYLIHYYHNSISTIIEINIAISIILLLTTFLYYVLNVGVNNRSGL